MIRELEADHHQLGNCRKERLEIVPSCRKEMRLTREAPHRTIKEVSGGEAAAACLVRRWTPIAVGPSLGKIVGAEW